MAQFQSSAIVLFTIVCLFSEIKCQNSRFRPKIVGGFPAEEGQFPYQVSLRLRGRHFCGGSIIDKRWILTAAHCLRGISDSDLTIVVGTTKLDEGGDVYRVAKIHGHEGYSSLFIRNDIGLIHLNEDITFSSSVQPIPLPTEDFDKSDTSAILSGWGITSYPGKAPNELQHITLTVIDMGECRKFSVRVTSKNICTLNGRGEGACHGDSGGPLVADGVQIGVVSWGSPCARGKPDVYTRVYSYVDWIKETMRETSDDDPSAGDDPAGDDDPTVPVANDDDDDDDD